MAMDAMDFEIKGSEMQFVEVELDPGEAAVGEAGSLFFMDAGVSMDTVFGDGSQGSSGLLGKLLGAGRRLITGESLFITVYTNQSGQKQRVAFAAPYAGKIVPMDLKHLGGTLICQKDAFLCAARGVSLGIHFQRKLSVGFFGGEGFVMQKLEGDGLAFVHAGGTVLQRELLPGQVLMVDTGCLVAYTPDVGFEIQYVGKVRTALFGGEGLFLAQLTGPGTVCCKACRCRGWPAGSSPRHRSAAARARRARCWAGWPPAGCSAARWAAADSAADSAVRRAATMSDPRRGLAPRGAGWLLATAVLCAAAVLPRPCLAAAAAADSPYTEELTWVELAARVSGGATTILLPIGGTEQNGPQMVLGKHNQRVRLLAGRIARSLGHTLVAPVLAYVPEGAIDPPAAHMRFAGTISVPEDAFEAVLASAARSFRRHGFREIVLLGDHGGYLKSLERVAVRLNAEWSRGAAAAAPPAKVIALTEYYRASVDGHARLLAARGFGTAEIGSHAGLADTALTLALDPSLVRQDQLQRAAAAGVREGVHGDPRRASAELGQIGVDLIVERSVAAIAERRAAR